jgi:hypothetical protein
MRIPLSQRHSMQPDPRLERAVRRLVLAGCALVVVLPAARGSSAWLGALPLWLLAMPLVSWWALHRFRLPRIAMPATPRRRRGGVQARRRRTMRPPVQMQRVA